MIEINLREGRSAEYELSHAQATELNSSRLVRVKLAGRGGKWEISDNGLVGAARVGDIELRITPKITIPRLFFLIGYAADRVTWRSEDLDAGAQDDLLPAIALAFARQAERALQQGVLLGYRVTEESAYVVRGRIRQSEQIRRRYGLLLPVELRYDDYTVDIAENQLLLSAAAVLLKLPGVTAAAQRTLRRLLLRLDGVTPLPPGTPLPSWIPSRLNTRYHGALTFAELILRGRSFEWDDGRHVPVNGLMLRMWQVFEDFVTAAFSDALRAHGGRCQSQETQHHLDHDRRIQLIPDLVYYRLDEAGREFPAAVLDAKYKVERTRTGHNPDYYQVLAYCTRLGLRRGHLIYAKGSAQPRTYRVAGGSEVEITQHALDLSQPPDELLHRISDLAARIADG